MDEENMAAGFIMNKLWTYGYVGARHTSLDNLPKGYPPSRRGSFKSATKRLRKQGLISVHPTSYGMQVSATVSMKVQALELANAYRISVGLLSLGLDLKEQPPPNTTRKSQ